MEDSTPVKACTRCHIVKPLELFNRMKKMKDGRHSWCKVCTTEVNTAWRRERGEKPKRFKRTERDAALLVAGLKVCVTCLETKVLGEFYAATRGYGGTAAKCKTCSLAWLASEGRANLNANMRKNRAKPAYKAYHRLSQAKRRGVIKSVDLGDVTAAFLESVYSQEFCFYCQRPTPKPERTLEHRLPLSRGGLHTQANITMACRLCNSSKAAMTEEEFSAYRQT